jgi:hypothetical protein
MVRRTKWLPFVLIAGLLSAAMAMAAEPVGQALDAKVIGNASGTDATKAPDGVVRITWSRSDVSVVVDGTRLPPAAGLGSWAAFAPMGKSAMVMGDTVVFEDEVDAAMDAAFTHGLNVTGLHNHFFYDSPKVYFMHVGGEGVPVDLARGIKAVWDAIKAVRKARPMPATAFGAPMSPSGGLDATAIERIVGHPTPVSNGVAKVTIGRKGEMHGTPIGASMGLTTWAAFSGSDAAATIDGDFIMTAEEVQPVLRALRKGGLHVVALHNHMLGVEPALYFTHFWGTGKALDLAKGFRLALDAQGADGKSSATH